MGHLLVVFLLVFLNACNQSNEGSTMQLSDLNPRYQKQVMEKTIEITKKVTPTPRPASQWEASLALALKALGIEVEREYVFHDVRSWRFDFAFPGCKLAVEVEGTKHDGKSRHQTKDGYHNDLVKYQAAMLDGWTVYRCDQELIKSGEAMATIEHMLARMSAGQRNTSKNTG